MNQMSAESVDHGRILASSAIKMMLMLLAYLPQPLSLKKSNTATRTEATSSLSKARMPTLTQAHTNYTETAPKIPKLGIVSPVGYKPGHFSLYSSQQPSQPQSHYKVTLTPWILHWSCLDHKPECDPERSIHRRVEKRPS